MTDPRTPPPDDRNPVDPDVALASAHVDGELDDADQARIAADPDASALAVRLAAIAHEVRDVPPPPSELVEAHVTAALAALDEVDAEHDDAGAVVPMRPARPDRTWWQRIPLGAVAAVVAVVALVGAIGLASQAGDDDTDTAATALDAAEGESGGDESVEDDAERSETFESSGGALAAPDAPRPAYDSYEELADALTVMPSTTAAGGGAGAGDGEGDEAADDTVAPEEEATADDGASTAPDPCGALDVLGLDEAEVEQVVPAVVAGEPVTAVVHVADGERRLSVVDDATCAVSFEQAL